MLFHCSSSTTPPLIFHLYLWDCVNPMVFIVRNWPLGCTNDQEVYVTPFPIVFSPCFVLLHVTSLLPCSINATKAHDIRVLGG